MKKLFTVGEVATLLNLSPATIRAWLAQGRYFSKVKCGRAVRIPSESIERFIERNTIPELEEAIAREKKAKHAQHGKSAAVN